MGMLKKGVSGVLGPLSCSRTPVRSARQSACGLAHRVVSTTRWGGCSKGVFPLRGVTGPAVWAVLGAEPLGKLDGKPGDHLAERTFLNIPNDLDSS